ncbi:MAG: NHLP bacteriocin system secretion protein [Opitutae bacterium]|nr:NHLP bacteriocin system secretion protein [Opitutae bacterium]
MSSPYRSDSLDSLVSSDDLDQASMLIKFRSLLFLSVFVLLISIAVACSILIYIPIKVSGPSVIWSDVGVLQVTAKDPGVVTSINVKIGDHVEAGQVIAVLDQSRVQDQLDSATFKLKALQQYISDIEESQTNDQKTREEFKKVVDDIHRSSEILNKTRLSRLNSRKEELRNLHKEGLIKFDQYYTFIDRIEDTESSIINDQRIVVSELKEENNKHVSEYRELLQKKLEADQLSSEVELLESQLADQGELRSKITGRVVEITSSVGDFLSPGSPVILVRPDSMEDEMTFVVFISSEQVKPVSVGMPTELELSAFPPTKYGKLVGRVKSISPMPLSSSGLMKELKNDQLVGRITEAGSPFMVKVEILRDPETGDFKWSSASKSERKLQVGMIGQGSVITREEQLRWLLLPQTE